MVVDPLVARRFHEELDDPRVIGQFAGYEATTLIGPTEGGQIKVEYYPGPVSSLLA